MDDVLDIERDFRRAKQGETLIYTTLHGLKTDLSEPRAVPNILAENVENLDQSEAKVELVNLVDQNKVVEANEVDVDEAAETYESEDESSSGTSSDSSDEEGGNNLEKNNKLSIHDRPRDESPNSKRVNPIFFINYFSLNSMYEILIFFKERKQAVKEEKREKRLHKTPKHVKKRAVRMAQIKKHNK